MGTTMHLGDGAYVTIDCGESAPELMVVFTANHHDPDLATDRVWLDARAVELLISEFRRLGLVGED